MNSPHQVQKAIYGHLHGIIKQVDLKKNEFDYGGMSRLKALSSISGPIGLDCVEGN